MPGVLWTPTAATSPTPLVLLGHPGGLDRMLPRLAGRARGAVAAGFAAATLELPGSGDRPRLPVVEAARADLRRDVAAGEPVADDVVDRLVLPLVELAVPEWRAALDALLALPEIGGPVGFSGGVTAIAVRLLVLLQWDDEGNDRQQALGLFDALGSREKTLHANTGGHTGVPAFEADDGDRFFARHLVSAGQRPKSTVQ